MTRTFRGVAAAAVVSTAGAGTITAANASSMTRIGTPLLTGTASLYARLLSGDRASMRSALTAPRQEITDIYRGAESSLDRSGVRGANREVASGTLARDEAGRLASLVPQARQQAMEGAGNLGLNLVTGGNSAISALMGNQTAQGQLALQQRMYGDQQSSELGGNLSKLLLDFYTAYNKSRRPGGGPYGGGTGIPGTPGNGRDPYAIAPRTKDPLYGTNPYGI